MVYYIPFYDSNIIFYFGNLIYNLRKTYTVIKLSDFAHIWSSFYHAIKKKYFHCSKFVSEFHGKKQKHSNLIFCFPPPCSIILANTIKFLWLSMLMLYLRRSSGSELDWFLVVRSRSNDVMSTVPPPLRVSK